MIAAPIPKNESARLEALHHLHILHTPREERFDRLTRLAMNLFQIPMAYLNLIDSETQWCKSGSSEENAYVDRSISFCGHTILSMQPFIVPDTLKDERFAANPLVTGGPRLRAYAGIPIFSKEGFCLGAFCIIDTKPRSFPSEQISLLRDLALIAENEITNVALNKSLEEARIAQKTAETADRAKSDFLAMISHEIRTPLNGIIGFTHMLLQGGLTQEQQDYSLTIQNSGETLLSLINDILDFSKIESGKLEIESVLIYPRQCVRDVLSFMTHTAAVKGIALKSRISPSVPAAVLSDAGRVRQILLNLTGNALKFTERGEVSIEIDVEKSQVPGQILLLFRIRDTGVGIPLESQSRLFKAFSQADSSTTRRYGGTGLGLAICKRLVELMGGTISLESVPEKGSTFTFTIAAGTASASEYEETSAPSKVFPPSPDEKRSLRILVAEDNMVNQRLMHLLLKKLGHEADCVESGTACLQRLKAPAPLAQCYDIILMDIQMPGMDGLETTQKIRAQFKSASPRPWIIAVTAHAMEEDRKKCLEAGMDDYITKPLRLELLHQALERFAKNKAV